MAEFKKLSEVEQIETASDNATVLVEEGGDIKRVPKKEVGGAGGYVIKLSESYIDDDGLYRFDSSYDELYDVLLAGGSVWADYTDAPEVSYAPMSMSSDETSIYDATNIGAPHQLIVNWVLTDVGLFLCSSNAYREHYERNDIEANIYFPNGSHNLERNEVSES